MENKNMCGPRGAEAKEETLAHARQHGMAVIAVRRQSYGCNSLHAKESASSLCSKMRSAKGRHRASNLNTYRRTLFTRILTNSSITITTYCFGFGRKHGQNLNFGALEARIPSAKRKLQLG